MKLPENRGHGLTPLAATSIKAFSAKVEFGFPYRKRSRETPTRMRAAQ
jgi:hypothetical protein